MKIRPLRNERVSDEDLFREREEVLAQWPTGKDVDIDDAIGFHKSLPDSKVHMKKLAEAKRKGDTLIHSFQGYPTVEWQNDIVKFLVEEGGADLCTTHVDAFTRNHMFPKAAEAVEESKKLGKAMLNGFPVLIHGVAGNRKLVENYPVPSQISGCSCDYRLTAEIAFAGGHTNICGGPFLPFFSYNRETSLETTIINWQYLFRLLGYYTERGAPIVNRPDGVLSSFIISPPSLANACRIMETLMGAEQGVKYVSLDSSTGGNIAQDIASAILLQKVAREYLDRFGYNDVELFTMTTGINGRYPHNHARAFAVLSTGPLIAALCKLQQMCIRTIDEAFEIPTKENSAASLRCGKMILNLYKGQNLGLEDTEDVKIELKMQEIEMKAVIDKVLEMGDGDLVIGAVRATESGVLDCPYSTARSVARRVIGVRDARGAIRFLDHGNLPFNKEILDYQKERIAERSRMQNKEVSYEAVIGDIFAVSEGSLISG
jgi:methylaspartate mutase epsilon subunit